MKSTLVFTTTIGARVSAAAFLGTAVGLGDGFDAAAEEDFGLTGLRTVCVCCTEADFVLCWSGEVVGRDVGVLGGAAVFTGARVLTGSGVLTAAGVGT